MRVICLLALVAGAGCFSPRYSNGKLHCVGTVHSCPDGYHCAVDQTCWQDSVNPPNADMTSEHSDSIALTSGGGVTTSSDRAATIVVGQPAGVATGEHSLQLGILSGATSP